jgi:hypothetical protein
VTRGQTFTGHSTQNKRLLRQFYDLRCCIEHVKNIEPALHKPRNVPRDEGFAFGALQTEIFASTIYSRIFTSDALREQLSSELRVEGFGGGATQAAERCGVEALTFAPPLIEKFSVLGLLLDLL